MLIPHDSRRQHGAAMIEILVSILITSFGLLALAGLQAKMNAALFESYQRAQALTLVSDMTQRMEANWNQTASYADAAVGVLGTGKNVISCAGKTGADLDLCEWSNALNGSAELSAGGDKLGGMVGARGCIEQVQAPNPATGICQPAIYRVTVAWQGMNATVAPAVLCAANLYGDDDSLRKTVTSRVVVPLSTCS